MKTKYPLAKALKLAVPILALVNIGNAHAAATTMYNLTTSGAVDNSANTTDPTSGGTWNDQFVGNTDGWIYGFTESNPNPSAGGANSVAQWAGTTGPHSTPFGYVGAHLNWGLEFTGGNGGTATLSSFDAFARYGSYADIDVANGAWSDAGLFNKAGWRHDLDFGLFRSDATGLVTLNAKGLIHPENSNFGFTIYQGMNTNALYNHHGVWNSGTNNTGLTNNSRTGGGTNLPLSAIVAYSIGDPATHIGTISFNATAGQIYTIVLGGFRTGFWAETNDGYQLSVSQAVPIPAAVWLFGSAMAGLGITGRRRGIAST